jgi:serine phosphatase RsbU (regulator of sigma subunit)
MPPLGLTASGSLARALSTGAQQNVSAAVPSTGSPLPVDPLDAEQSRLFDELGMAHALVTPLTARHQTLGAMTWARRDPGSPFTPADRLLATEAARRAGLALENARLYGQQRAVAETLQRSLLTVLPEPDLLHLTARYLPASRGAEVGGDWYDAFTDARGQTLIVIGDISGHDITAASKMGQVRNVLRALCWDRDEPPSGLMTRLDATLEGLRGDVFATCVLARIEQSPADAAAMRWILRWTSAGHLPIAVVTAEGRVGLMDDPTDLMLGVDPSTARHDNTIALHPGDTVWLYTDGLVERSTESIDQGLARLRQALAAVHRLPLEQGCDELLSRMVDDGHTDDVAVLALRAFRQDRPRPRAAGLEHR